eukprot:m.257303 g.257303  ORF g.257303 m.257303 type:complete len:66 (-) comp54565_c0_seq1:305-502(-)
MVATARARSLRCDQNNLRAAVQALYFGASFFVLAFVLAPNGQADAVVVSELPVSDNRCIMSFSPS